MSTTTPDKPKKPRKRDWLNPFPLKIASAKVMLEQGTPWREVAGKCGLSKTTVGKISKGEYDSKIPASTLEHARATMTSKLDIAASLVVDSVIEDPEVIEEATLAQRAKAVKDFVEVSQLLKGLPTSRVDHILTMSDAELDDELERTQREILQITGQFPQTIDAETGQVID